MSIDPKPRPTLLIVDDEPDVLESLRHLFRHEYRVLTATSGAEALEILGREEVQVILTDQRMPGMSGDELLGRARQIRPEAIRLLFTGYAEIHAVVKAVNQGGIFRYLLKPWDPDELESVVRQAADQYELLAERRRLLGELQSANARLLEANRELAEANELKTVFLEVASHEFNTPITIIQGLSELLKLVNPDREPRERDMIAQLSESARQLARLVTTMLKLVQASDFRQSLRVQEVDLAALLRGVVDQLRPFVESRFLRLEVSIPDTLDHFHVDPDKVRDITTNLLTNAIKFTPDGGELSVSARLSPQSDGSEEAVIEVTDKGIGLEPRALDYLFQPFFTDFDPTRHSSGDFGFGKRGLGLGLSLVKKFVALHGGRIEARSCPGEGTCVTVYLPRRPRPESSSVLDYHFREASPKRSGDTLGTE